ncbi:MAG: PadR family transcriptional regulator [Acidobacteria bacterium]|nr:PadR family transcriptional regulator [Acidobacteriota bacterium]
MLLLFAVLRLGDDGYGAAVAAEIESRTGREVAHGAVYTGLDRLEARGLLASTLGTPTAGRGGRPRRYYRLEAAGEASLARSIDAIDRIADGMRDALPQRDGGS